MEQCPCKLAPIATEAENKAAHDKKRCQTCYEIEQYAEMMRRRMLDTQSKEVTHAANI